MIKSTTPALIQQSTPHVTVVALGLKIQHLDLFHPIREQVHIKQKTVRYMPTDKRYDGPARVKISVLGHQAATDVRGSRGAVGEGIASSAAATKPDMRVSQHPAPQPPEP